MPKKNQNTRLVPGTRAVQRTIEAGSDVYCAGCDELIKFRAKMVGKVAVCNVYVMTDGEPTWDRVENFHDPCYRAAGAPHGQYVDAPDGPIFDQTTN